MPPLADTQTLPRFHMPAFPRAEDGSRGTGTFPRLLFKSVSLCLLYARVVSVKSQNGLPDPKCDRDSGALKTGEQHFIQDRRAHVVNPSSHHCPHRTVLQLHGLVLYFSKHANSSQLGDISTFCFCGLGRHSPST